MSKKYYIMNNRENPHDGYTEVSEEYVKNYKKSFPEGERAYFINLGYAIMETNKTEYKKFYKEYRRRRYVDEEAHRAGIESLNAIDSDELDGTGVVADTSEPLEEGVQRQFMIEKLSEALSILSDAEKKYIELLYFKEMTERQAAKAIGIAQPPFNRRKKRILKKISNFFEN